VRVGCAVRMAMFCVMMTGSKPTAGCFIHVQKSISICVCSAMRAVVRVFLYLDASFHRTHNRWPSCRTRSSNNSNCINLSNSTPTHHQRHCHCHCLLSTVPVQQTYVHPRYATVSTMTPLLLPSDVVIVWCVVVVSVLRCPLHCTRGHCPG